MYQKLRFLDKKIAPSVDGKFAVIDLGSNSFKVTIFNDIEKYPYKCLTESYRTRLSEDRTDGTFEISADRLEESCKVLK